MGIKMGPQKIILKLSTNIRPNSSDVTSANPNIASTLATSNVGTIPANQNIASTSVISNIGVIPVVNTEKFSVFIFFYLLFVYSMYRTQYYIPLGLFQRYGTIAGTLSLKSGGSDILKALKLPKIFGETSRKALVRLVTAELVDYYQSQ